MAYVWSKELETGNIMIDSQHKQLFQAINELLDACSGGKGRAELDRTIDFLVSYTGRHFADEEALQQKAGYPGYAAHKRYHDQFTGVVRELASELRGEGATLALVFKVNRNVGDWLVSHIKIEDKKLAEYLQSHK